MPDPVHPTVDAWTQAALTGDAESTRALMAPDVVLRSPVTDAYRFEGRDDVVALLGEAFRHARGYAIRSVVQDGDAATVVLDLSIGGVSGAEVQVLRLNEDGLIAEAELFVRPATALTQLARLLGPHPARRAGQRFLAGVLTASTTVLAGMQASGDRSLVSRIKRR